MKGWFAVYSAVFALVPPAATAAEDLSGAARELARKTAVFVGRREPVSLTLRNNSSSPTAPDLLTIRRELEAGLRLSGVRIADGAPVEARVTLSENQTQYLLVEEIRKGDERQVWIATWKRAEAVTPTAAMLEKRLLLEQDEPILDFAQAGEVMLVLSPWKVTWLRAEGPVTIKAPAPRNPPRDARGHLRANGPGFEVDLPGVACKAAVAPPILDCKAGDDPWVLQSGGNPLFANFAASRNYFDGRVAIQTGLRKTITPFYSSASLEDNGKLLWLIAMVDGRTQIYDASFDPVGVIPGWGSDIAGTEARCGGISVVLATRPGDSTEPDAIQAFTIVNRAAVPLSVPLDLPGPVTALWPSNGGTVAVVRDLRTGKYAAYFITVACGA